MPTYDIVFTDAQFIAILQNIADNLPTAYNNIPYYNCGYYTGTEWTFDCWNLIKSIIWGWQPVQTVGYYCYNPGLHGLGDWDGVTLLGHCTGVSTYFDSIAVGEYLYLDDTIDHAGIFIGEQTIGGRVVNVVEATPIWNNGVQYSYVDSSGTRFQYMGGTAAGTWTAHGKLPWIDYGGTPSSTRSKLPVWMMYRYPFG